MKKKRRSRQFKDNSKVIDMETARKQRQAKRNKDSAPKKKKVEDSGRKIKRKQEMRKKQGRRRLVIILIALVVAVIVGFSVFNIVKLKHEQTELLKKQEQLEKQKKELEQNIKDIDDQERIEDQARSKLKMLKPGETVYIPDEDMEKATDESN